MGVRSCFLPETAEPGRKRERDKLKGRAAMALPFLSDEIWPAVLPESSYTCRPGKTRANERHIMGGKRVAPQPLPEPFNMI